MSWDGQERREHWADTGNPFNLPSFREELGKLLDEKLAPIHELAKTVAVHETEITKAKGFAAAVATLWSLFVIGIEWLLHRH